MNQGRRDFGSVLSLAIVLASPSAVLGQQEKVSQADVNQAIDRGVAFLKAEQQPDGHWPYPTHDVGMTALAGLALLENGVPQDDPTIARATSYIRSEAARTMQTYDVALAILYLARLPQDKAGADVTTIQELADRLDAAGNKGSWSYLVPSSEFLENMRGPRVSRGDRINRPGRGGNRAPAPRARPLPGFPSGDNSNTQFALLGLWAAGRNGFDSSPALKEIDGHFRSTVNPDGRWGYTAGTPGTNAMTCAGLMGLAIAAARVEGDEHKTARARGDALAADPSYQRALKAVTEDARNIDHNSDIYYLWSLERVCVALGLRELDGFDWYDAGARELLRKQAVDGGWFPDRWGQLPSTALALLFLRKANLAFEIDLVLRMPGSLRPEPAAASAITPALPAPEEMIIRPANEVALNTIGVSASPPETLSQDGPAVVVTGANDANFPEIAVDFELRGTRGDFILDATKEDFTLFEEGREMDLVRFLSPYGDPQPITVVLVVDRSASMEEEDRIGGLKRAVGSFLQGLPRGSQVAVVAFGSNVERICPFTDDVDRVQAAVDRLTPSGATRYYDAVAESLDLILRERGRRAVLALTDGQDTSSQNATLESVTAQARRLGLPVHTLGLGSEDEIESDALRTLATETRGQYYPAREADQLRRIYQQLAERLRSSYTVVYRSDRKIPDGTLRPVRVVYRSSGNAGETAVFIPGMVVPASGWSRLLLVMITVLVLLFTRWKPPAH
ncbi:MAG: VWA domain-containing protein [Isosphaeraceae bacterium]